MYFCKMAEQFDKNLLIERVKAGEQLTREEERFYMIKVLGCTEKQVDHIFAINDNEDPGLIID